MSPRFSVVIPVHNNKTQLGIALEALRLSDFWDFEVLVADDGSSDGSGDVAQSQGAKLVRINKGPLGPAIARNTAARQARGEILFFTDADVSLLPNTLSVADSAFQETPQYNALIGSYDDDPAATNFVSQYKNLFHHFVHQHAAEEASTFFGACGAVRREAFMASGGFDESYSKPSIEDIALGYRLKKAGWRIRLVKQLQVKHLKKWTLADLILCDVFRRAIPWTRLMRKERMFVSDLNVKGKDRFSALLALAGTASIVGTAFNYKWLWPAVACMAAIVFLNSEFYRFFVRKRGLLFTAEVLPMHMLYFLYSLAGFAAGTFLSIIESLRAPRRETTPSA